MKKCNKTFGEREVKLITGSYKKCNKTFGER